jgi:hypothetical protein
MHRARLVVLILALLPLGCAAQQSDSQQTAATSSKIPTPATSERKIVYRADVRLAVEHFDEVPSQVDALTARFEGFVAQMSLYGSARDRRQGSWTIRVPAARYKPFLEALGGLGEIISLQGTSEDKTTEWVDLDARLRNARTQEQRLLGVLSDATGKLDEVLAVEKELARVRGEIEQMQARQRLLDETVSLSTVTLAIDEIKEYFPDQSAGYVTRLRRSLEISLTTLRTALQGLSIIAIAALPWLATLLAPPILIAILIRVYKRRRRVPAQLVT